MTSVLVVADSGSTMEAITGAVIAVRGAHIVRHGSCRAALDRLVSVLHPDLVVIGDARTRERARARVSEVRGAAPHAKVVVLSSRADAGRLCADLRPLTATVLAGDLDPATLGVALGELLAEPDAAAPAAAGVPPSRIPRTTFDRRHRGRRPTRGTPTSHGGVAA
jgi:DNA-binding NarL/FixJ family response regulator